jgi:hypothetical protein
VANRSYASGSVTVGTTATLVASVAEGVDGVLLQNLGSAAIFVGGPAVTASAGANQGISIAQASSMLIPGTSNGVHDVWAIVAAATQPLNFLYPA